MGGPTVRNSSVLLPLYAMSDVLTVPEAPVIPTLSQWGLIMLDLLLLTAMFVASRRRTLSVRLAASSPTPLRSPPA